jgi:2'-5' RNA ligase
MSRTGDEIRCFLAANLSTEPLRKIQALQRKLREVVAPTGFPLRWVPVENIHLTFKFFGEISQGLVPAIEREVGRVLGAEPPLCFDVVGVRAFPPGRPRMIWADVREPDPPRLTAVHGRIEDALAEIGLEREARPFHAHLTIARARPGPGGDAVAVALQDYAQEELGRTLARELVLFQSDLRPEGPRYTVLRRLGLQET